MFADEDGLFYMYFGGIQGGQLQRWPNNEYRPDGTEPAKDQLPILPRVVKMSANMLGFSEPVREIKILDQAGVPIVAGDLERRFFEACWIHKYKGIYYFSYSTGTTHNICYATGKSPYGPFTYRGILLKPVQGWTTQQSIVEFKGKWYLFYHDTQLSGENYLRNIKMTELKYNEDGTIGMIDPLKK
jgi:Glycosyl hydrolases family 43